MDKSRDVSSILLQLIVKNNLTDNFTVPEITVGIARLHAISVATFISFVKATDKQAMGIIIKDISAFLQTISDLTGKKFNIKMFYEKEGGKDDGDKGKRV